MPKDFNSPDPKGIGLSEFLGGARSGRYPDLVFIMQQSEVIPVENFGPEKMSDITIEKIEVFGKESKWRFEFLYGNFDRVKIDISSVDHRPLQMQVRDLGSNQVRQYLWLIDGTRVLDSTTRAEKNLAPLPSFHGREKPAREGRVKYNTQRNLFVCSCWLKNEVWCEHVDQFIWTGRDRAILDLKINDKNCFEYDFTYTIAGGSVLVTLSLERNEFDLGEGIVDVQHKLSYNEDISLWLQPTDAGASVLRLVSDWIVATPDYKRWMEWVEERAIPKGFKCPNKNHSWRDNEGLRKMLSTALETETTAKAFAFANAYYELTDARCMSCFNLLSNFSKDIPTGL